MSVQPSTEDVGRRRFLARAVQSLHAAIAATVGVVLGGAVLSPSLASRRQNWLSAGSFSGLRDQEPTPVTIRVVREDGYNQVIERQVVFLVKTGESEVTALSSTCTHLGCRVSWVPDARELHCPCHGGIYDATGAVKAGPPSAPLARLSARLDGDHVLVQL